MSTASVYIHTSELQFFQLIEARFPPPLGRDVHAPFRLGSRGFRTAPRGSF